MKNWAFKNFGFKRAFIITLCMCAIFALSTFLGFVIYNQKSEAVLVQASENVAPIQDREYSLDLDEFNGEEKFNGGISIASVNFATNTSFEYALLDDSNFNEEAISNFPQTIPAGTTIQIVSDPNNDDLYNRIQFTNTESWSRPYTIVVKCKLGYNLEGFWIGDEGLTTEIAEGNANYTLISEIETEGFCKTTEEIDSNFTGTIKIKPNVKAIEYEVEMYYETNSTISYGTYSYETGLYSIEKSYSFSSCKPSSGSKVSNKEFDGWYLKYPGTTYTGGANKQYTIAISGSTCTVTATNLEVKITIGSARSVNGQTFYPVTSVIGYGYIDQSTTGPLIMALWKNTYTVCVYNGSSFWSANDPYYLYHGVGTSRTSYASYKNLAVSYTSSYPFVDSYYNGKGFSFMKQSEVGSNYNSSEGYYVYNFGHYVSGWTVHVDEKEYPFSTSSKSLGNLAAELDTKYAASLGFPSVSITPIWTKATVTPTGLSSAITFNSSYSLSGGSVDDGQTLFAYTYASTSDSRYVINETELVASSAIWNYLNIDYNAYTCTTSNGSAYTINLTGVGLDNVYKIGLENAKTNIVGNYEIECDDYLYYSSTGGYNNSNADSFSYLDLKGAFTTFTNSGKSWVDDYVSEILKVYANEYSSAIDGDNTNTEEIDYEIFNCVHYSEGSVSGSELTATMPSLWIYLANGQTPKPLPMFKTKYETVVYWTFNNVYGLKTDGWEEEFTDELEMDDGRVISLQDSLNYRTMGIEATAVYMKRINLYYLEDNSEEYSWISASSFGEKVVLTLTDKTPDPDYNKFNNRIYGGWVFNTEVAKSSSYNYEVLFNSDKTQMSVITADGTTYFTIEKLNEHNTNLVYVTAVWGSMFKQADDAGQKPIITMREAHKFDFKINNEDTYWANDYGIKDSTELYGAAVGTKDEDGVQAYEVEFKVADNEMYAYPIMTSQFEDNGLAFYKEDFNKNYAATVPEGINDNGNYYYVYNYGHKIIGWKIYFEFKNNSSYNAIISSLKSNTFSIETNLNYEYCYIDNIKSLSLINIARVIDDYMIGNAITEIPTITMIPVWEEVTIDIKVNGKNYITTNFGDIDYSIPVEDLTSNGQKLFTLKTSQNNFISPNGRWNYKTINSGCFKFNNTTTSAAEGIYIIDLRPEFVDNIYKVKLDNAVAIETNKYQLSVGEFENSLYNHDIYTFEDDDVLTLGLENSYKYTTYEEFKILKGGETKKFFIDDYISTQPTDNSYFSLEKTHEIYNNAINGDGEKDFTILGKTYATNGTISSTINNNDTLDAPSTPVFYIYLANNQNVGVLPEFAHDLSMLIHWQNSGISSGSEKTYLTTSGDESEYVNELKYWDSDSNVYAPSIKWSVVHGGSEGTFLLTARYVYSVRLYYSNKSGGYSSINSNEEGHFGKYTAFNLLNADDEEKFIIDPTAKKQEDHPNDKIFERWVFDADRASEYDYIVEYDKTTKVLTVNKGDDTWQFACFGQNKFNENYYYITNIRPSFTRFIQDDNNPIIYAKWVTLFNTTIDNGTSKTYWVNIDGNNPDLYGAYSYQEEHDFTNDDFRKTTFKIANISGYDFNFMTSSDKSSNRTSFYHNSDFEAVEEKENVYGVANSGWYYLFNYGHYISGYQITLQIGANNYFFTKSGDDWDYSTTSSNPIVLNQLTSTTMQKLAEIADELALQHDTATGEIVIIPYWEAVSIIAKDSYGDELASTTFGDISGYKIEDTDNTNPSDEKSITHYYYGDSENNIIASVINNNNISGIWNYRYIEQNAEQKVYTYSNGTENRDENGRNIIGSGTYSITLYPYYVDNIYRVNLEGAVSKANGNKKTFTLTDGCDYKFFKSSGVPYGNTSNTLTFQDKLDENYTFIPYSNEPLIDTYISVESNGLNALVSAYENGIATENADSCFDIFKKVYHSVGTLADNDESCLDLIVGKEDDVVFHMYLANAQLTGNLPVFKQTSYALIFWENVNRNKNDKHFIYTTNEYQEDIHLEETRKECECADEKHSREMQIGGKWSFVDGYETPDIVTFTAVYYRKNHSVQISTLNSDNEDVVERRGYVRLTIIDELAKKDASIKDTGGDYIFIFNGTDMVVYKYNDGALVDNSNFNNGTLVSGPIRLYEGSYVTMSVYDQSKDVVSMKSGRFDDMIGYKFTGRIEQSGLVGGIEKEIQLFTNLDSIWESDEFTSNDYIYHENLVDEELLYLKDYPNNTTFKINVYYERITYNLTVQMDNVLAGEFNLFNQAANTGNVTKYNLTDVRVQQLYKVEYSASAGFKHKNNSFVLSNGKRERGLQTYDDITNISQEYVVTGENDYEDYSLDGAWLRLYFYVDYDNYAVNLTTLGTLWVATTPIEFTYGVKVYDESDARFADSEYIIETFKDISANPKYVTKLSLDEKTGIATTQEIYKYLEHENHEFYYYVSTEDVEYALLSTRMFFTKDHTLRTDNFYTTYSFLLEEKPINQATLRSEHISKMVNNYEEGKIISWNDRNIYIMLEVRKLLTIEMSVAVVEDDSNTTTRITTLSNADNNNTNIIIDPGANEEFGYFITTNNTSKVVAYTYFGLKNSLSSEFDTARYGKVQYILNNNANPLVENSFTVEENSELLIKYIPQSLAVEIVYKKGSVEVEESEVQGIFLTDVNIYKPNPYSIYEVGDSLTYSVECIHPDYDIVVAINNKVMGTTTPTSRIIALIKNEENGVNTSYIVTDYDYNLGKITIEVNVVEQNKEQIHVQYQLTEDAKVCSDDDYGTFSVYEEHLGEYYLKAENVKSENISIVKGRDVYVTLNLPFGYQYVGIRYSSNMTQYIEPIDGKIKLVGDFNPETNSGYYFIMIAKRPISAILNTSNVNKNSTYLMLNQTNSTGWRKDLTGLYVGSVVEFKSEPSVQERLDYFYYLDAEENPVPLTNESGNPLMRIVITSAMLEKINNTVIDFGVAIVNRNKLELLVDDTSSKYLDDDGLTLEIKQTGEKYKSGDYIDVNTEITITARTKIEGKYDITLTMQPPANPQDVAENVTSLICDVIYKGDVVIKLNQDYVYTLTITPKQYQVVVEENLYSTLTEVQENNPASVEEQDHVNSITTIGQKYNENARITFVRKTEDRELSAVFISNNDNSDDLVIEFTKNTHIVYKLVEGEKETVNLMDYGFVIVVSETQITLTYVTYNNIDIRFDYKEYKILDA